jgi:excinuclease UvrABC nuclease subunit
MFEQKEQELIQATSLMWHQINELPKANGVYMICHIDFPNVIYIGESKNMWDRFWKHHRTGNASSFRDNLKRANLDNVVEECTVKFIVLQYGRKELEEYLIAKYNPKFNRLGNDKSKTSKR